jgi:hypothetical protein
MALYARDAGVWKPSYEPSVRNSSVWKPLRELYARDAGVWKPILVDPNYSSVVLLLHGDGTNGSTTITDNSPTPKTVTAVGDTQISTAQSVFAGGSSIRLDGSGDYITVPSSTDFAFGTGDFTLEFFVRFNVLQTVNSNMVHTNINGGFAIYQTPTAGSWQIARSGIASELAFSWSPVISTWYHFAVSRTSGTMKVFIDGVQVASGASATSFLQNGFWFGRDYLGALSYANCWAEEIRITKGVGRYTAAFTAPTIPFKDR